MNMLVETEAREYADCRRTGEKVKRTNRRRILPLIDIKYLKLHLVSFVSLSHSH